MLSNEDKKLLTEWLGEKWYEIDSRTYGICPNCKSEDISPKYLEMSKGFNCYACGCDFSKAMTENKRPFTTSQDAHDLTKKLVEVGEWRFFCDTFAFGHFAKSETSSYNGAFIAWLFASPESPARFCWLVAKYLEDK